MADPKTTRRAVLGAIAAAPIVGASVVGEAAASGLLDVTEPTELRTFARAWLEYWHDLGHEILPHGTLRWRITEPTTRFLWRDTPPHLSLLTRDHHEGATRALETLLDAIEGGREAVLALVDAEALS